MLSSRSRPSLRAYLALAAASAVAVSTAKGQSYTVSAPIGLLAPSTYVSSDGVASANVLGGSMDGFIVGTATRYNGGPSSSNFGTDGWSYNAANQTTTEMGLFSATADSYGVAYQSSTGTRTINIATTGYAGGAADVGTTSRSPEPYGLPIDGAVVAGTSNRYLASGTTAEGTDGWAYNGLTGATNLISLTDADSAATTGSTATDGFRSSGISWIAPNGYIVGFNSQYQGSSHTSLGSQPWIYNPTTGVTTALSGLTGSGDGQGYFYHTPQNSTQDKANFVDTNGNAAGVAQVFSTASGTTSLGTDAWYYNGSTQSFAKIGLYGTIGSQIYTATSGTVGTRSNSLSLITNTGYAAGSSTFYAGGSSSNQSFSVWVYDASASTTTNIGLTTRRIRFHNRNGHWNRRSHV